MQKIILFMSLLLLSFTLHAGGKPELVQLPEGYKADFKQYHEMNRVGKPQVAVLFANQKAIDSVGSGQVLDDAIVIMEIYKAKMDEAGKPVVRADGLYEKGKFAAIAVMEKQQWGEEYPQAERSGDWGFAIYNSDGTPKTNNLDCASCHTPFKGQAYLYTFKQLTSVK